LSPDPIGRQPSGAPPRLPLAYGEFIALLAWLTAMTALSIDIMLPALPDIAQSFRITSENDRQLIVTAYLGGLAVGQLLWGHVSDRVGRRLPLVAGLALYVAGTAAALWASSFALLIAARALAGLGGAAARTISTAIVRDVFTGRDMARTMSFVMMVFILVPMLAPSLGQGLLIVGSWRWCFAALLGAGLIAMLWVATRLPETRASGIGQGTGSDRPRLGLGASLATVLSNRVTRGYGLAAGLMFGCLVAYISSAQQIFVDAYGLGSLFPLAFGGIAAAMAAAAFTNAQLVQRRGMRRLSHVALIAFVATSCLLAVLTLVSRPPFWLLFALLAVCFFLFTLMQSNFNAIAMQPMGHVAGMASSLLGAFVTATGVVLGGLIGRSFDGSALPLAVGFAALGACAFLVVLWIEGLRGLFRGE
jgi:DHA1 family bicyclomycin/chloramphenicol resistance-like MFS transporter